MNIEIIKLEQIKPAEYNPRQINSEEFDGLKASLKTFGQQENLIVNKDMTLISGHMRLEAMKALGMTEATCNIVDLSKTQEMKLNVLMNSEKIAGRWDDLKLAEVLEQLRLDEDYEALRLDKLEPLDLSDNAIKKDLSELDKDLDVYLNGSIKQIVLYFDNDQFLDAMSRIEVINKRDGFENNTELFLAMLKFYEDNYSPETGS